MRKSFLAIVAFIAMLAATMGVSSPAGAQTSSDVFVLHGIPGVDVDIYVNGQLTLEGFEPKDIAGPLSLPAGDYDIDIFAADASPTETADERTDAVVIDVDGAAIPESSNVSLIAHLTNAGVPTLGAFVNNMSEVGNGEGRVTVRHTAEAPPVDILANGAVVFDAVPNGVGGNVALPAGELTVAINVDSNDAEVLTTPLTVQSANNRIVYAIGTAGSTFDLLVQDIAVPEAAPSGAPASVSVVHGIPGLTVDVYANGAILLPAFAPNTVTDVLSLPSGAYDITIFAAADSPSPLASQREDAPAISVVDAVVPAGANATLVAHLDGGGTPVLTPFVNDVTAAAAGNGRIEIRHTAQAPTVDIVAGGAAVAPFVELSNGDAVAAELPAGEYPTGIAATGTTAVLFDAPVTSVAGQYTVVYAVGSFPDTFGLVAQTFEIGEAASGGDTVADAESFDDILSASDYKPVEHGQILRLYQAFFDRQADVEGAKYWIGQLESGALDLGTITTFFAHNNQPEFVEKYADIDADDNTGYVTKVYQHILDRDPDATGLAYWVGLMDDGSLNRGTVVQFIALNTEFINLFPYDAK